MRLRFRSSRIRISPVAVVATLGILFAYSVLADAALADEPAGEAASQADTAGDVSFYKQVLPILQARCQGCHQPAKANGSLVLTSYETLLEGGDTDAAVVAGKPDESLLIDNITPIDGMAIMPPEGDPLTSAEVNLVRRWVEQGAKNDSPAETVDPISPEQPPVYTSPPVVTTLDFSPDGQMLAVSGYHEVLLYRSGDWELAGRLVGRSQRIESVAFSPDGKLLAVTGGSPCLFGEVQIWDVAEKTLKLSKSITHDTIYGASWSPDGTKLAFGCADNTLRAINAATGEEILYQGAHEDWVLDTTFSTDASHLISVSRDRSMKLTEVATQRFVDNITSITPGALKGGLMAVDRHPKKDELLVGGADGVPKLYQTYRTRKRQIGDDFNLIRKFAAMPGRIFAVEFNADGSRVVAGSSSDGTGEVRVYQTEDAKLVSTFSGQQGPVYAVTFHPEGDLVATAGFDGTVRLNDPKTGELIQQFVAVPLTPGDAVTRLEE